MSQSPMTTGSFLGRLLRRKILQASLPDDAEPVLKELLGAMQEDLRAQEAAELQAGSVPVEGETVET